MKNNHTQQFTNSPLNKEISWFPTVKATVPTSINLLEYLTAPLSPDTIGLIERIRTTADHEVRRKLKQQLPAITPSGKFTKRSTACIEAHSGLISIDIDGKDNPDIDMSELKKELIKLPQVCYAGRSVSGMGLWALIAIAYPDMHGEHFDFLVQFFQNFGIVIDDSGRDITRMRIQSYDPDPLFNHNAIPLTQFIEKNALPIDPDVNPASQIKPEVNRAPPPNFNDNIEPYLKNYNIERLVDALSYMVTKHRIDITDSQQKWFKVGCVLANRFGENGRKYYHSFSMHHPRYQHVETENQYDMCLRGNYKYGIGTLIQLCMEKGIAQFKDTVTFNDTQDYILI